jgi:RimJ/RimL family protein N-acetyltransferase
VKQPVIETKRLMLRPFYLRDAIDVQKLAGNRNVSESTLNIPYPYKDGMAESWIAEHENGWKNKSNVTYAIVDKLSTVLLGVVSLLDIRGEEAKLGYWIGEPFWGNGYCTEATRELLELAHVTMGIKKIIGEHLCSNPASGRVMEKLGMSHKGQIRGADRYKKEVQIAVYESERVNLSFK